VEKTADDGQRNCPKHVEFYSKNKFEKLVRLIGLIVMSMDALPTNRSCPPSCSHGTYQHKAITSRSRQLLMMGTRLPEKC